MNTASTRKTTIRRRRSALERESEKYLAGVCASTIAQHVADIHKHLALLESFAASVAQQHERTLERQERRARKAAPR